MQNSSRRCPHHFSFPFTFFTLQASLLQASKRLSKLLHFTSLFILLWRFELLDLVVLLLEIISGKHAIDVTTARP